MIALSRLLAWQSKNKIHDYRLGTLGHKLLYDYLEEIWTGKPGWLGDSYKFTSE